jgi:exopolysaccharide biosynthesis polyprenyl glycosylphosphotransferase
MYFHWKSEYLRHLLLLLDLSVSALVFLLILNLYGGSGSGSGPDIAAHIGLLVVLLIIFGATRQYVFGSLPLHPLSLKQHNWRVLSTMAITLALLAALIFVLKIEFVSRGVLLGFVVINSFTLVVLRSFLVWWYFTNQRESGDNHLKILIVGSGARARSLGARLQNSFEWGVRVVGYLDPKGESAGRRATDNILGHVDQITEILSTTVVDEVIVAVPRSMLENLQSIVDACQLEGVDLRFQADIYDFDAARVRLTMFENIPLLSFEPVAQDESRLIVKRMMDLFLTLLAFPILVPIFAIVAVAVRIDSSGPVFFTQDRVGLHKRRFKMYKFRSMVADAEAKMAEVEHLNEADGPNFKIADDPRITRIGQFLRKTSLDELPQLINVLRGDMSLVGPRPMSLRDVELFDQGLQRRRFSVRPGITCLWQISGRSDLTFDQWLALDLQYINNWSLALDFKILFLTVPSVLKGSGAQ